MVESLHSTIRTAMNSVRNDVAGDVRDLTAEIRHGGNAVVRTLRVEAGAMRAELGKIVSNNQT